MTPLRRLREAAGLTQSDLAQRAGLSRQLVSAAESGRHLPRVDAALALARALDVEVAALFPLDTNPVDVVSGRPSPTGLPVQVGRVGDRLVTSPAGIGGDGWDVADAVVGAEGLDHLAAVGSGLVVVGCEPGLEVLERMLREKGRQAMAVTASSAAARSALAERRAHAAVVHGSRRPRAGGDVARFRLAGWRVGLAGSPGADRDWWRQALSGDRPVVQREAGAEAQRAFEAVAGVGVPGPIVGSHLEAARSSLLTGLPGVTIEPAALAVGARFHPIESHLAELWVGREFLDRPEVEEALDLLSGRRFVRRLESVGGYDLSRIGSRLP